MRYIECPGIYDGNEPSLFIAGGISNCADWQSEFIKKLDGLDITVLNPRRKNFDVNDPRMEEEQIKWEFDHLLKADACSFWFTKETLCPITLYELGKQTVLNKTLFVGVHPNYKRKKDVEIQTKLERPEVDIVYSLDDLAKQVYDWRMGK